MTNTLPKLSPKNRRTVFETLSRERLSEFSDHFKVEVEDRRVNSDHIDALVRSRKVDFIYVLRALTRVELKQICVALGIPDSGRELDGFIQRILALGIHEESEDILPSPPLLPTLEPKPVSFPVGSATPLGADGVVADHPRLRTDGPCISETLLQLEAGFGGTKINRNALERIRLQAEDVLEDVIKAYVGSVAPNEVGAHGSAKASVALPSAGTCPTGLLYGRIQSGKTNAMIVTTALAIDNGFRVVVVYTSNFVKLVEQTVARFKVLDGPLLYSSIESGGGNYQWEQDEANIRRHIGEKGLVVVCAKDSTHQRALLDLLKRVNASEYPAVIFDDEADQATPDTTSAARASNRASAPAHGSVTYRLTVENDAADEPGESTREILRHNVFLQVTATPYALLLQNSDSPLRPKFTRLLEPGEGYTGGEHFFSNDQVRNIAPPLVLVDESEAKALLDTSGELPEGLAKGIIFFLLSAAAIQHLQSARSPEGFKFLCHTSPKTAEHERAGVAIRTFVDEISAELMSELGPKKTVLFDWAYTELQKTLTSCPPLQLLKSHVAKRIPHRRVLMVNSQSGGMAEFGPSFNFVIGGNILGRGLTIDNLMVTYYLRNAKSTQMDTMLQHARMYGYRKSLMPFTRVFLPESLAVRFNRIHDSETKLRTLLKDPATSKVPVRVAGDLRPTRRNVLDPGTLGALHPGQQVYPSQPEYRPEPLGRNFDLINNLLTKIFDDKIREHEFQATSIETIIELIDMVRTVDDDDGDWDPPILKTVLRSISNHYQDTAFVFVRDAKPERGPVLGTGILGGAEQEKARSTKHPVLFFFRVAGQTKPWAGTPFWYPTLVMPSDMPVQVFNVTS